LSEGAEEPRRPGRASTWPLWLAGVLVALGVLVVRVALDGRRALRAGEAAEARGERGEAIRHYLDAARFYLPGSPTVRRALDHLQRLAAVAQAAGDPAAERPPLEAIRAALLGTRSFYTPHAARLPEVERRLAEVYAQLEDPRVEPGASPQMRAAWHASRLSRHPGPILKYVILALLGLALWLAGVVAFVRRGLDAGLRLRRGPALAAGVVFAVGFALFVTGLRLA
jgi:hypothetical protein